MELLVGALERWAQEHHIEELSVQSFWQCVRSYQVENREECLKDFGELPLDEAQFTVAMSKVSLTLNEWPECGHVYVTAFIPITYRGRDMGMYRAVFSLAGECEDDYFHIDPMPVQEEPE